MGNQRQTHLDQLRGLAVLGIFPVNIFLFGWPKTALSDPIASGFLLSTADVLAWSLMHLLFEQKFINLLALMFGVGIGLFAQRQSARGHDPGPLHVRRMLTLASIGLLHAYLIWWGDILFVYSLAGLLAWTVRTLGPGALIQAGLVIYAVPSLLLVLWQLGGLAPDLADNLSAPSMEQIFAEIQQYRGGWREQMSHRAATALTLQTSTMISATLWHALGLILAGMGLQRLPQFLSGQWIHSAIIRWYLLGALITGALLMTVSLGIRLAGGDLLWAFHSQYWGSLGMSVAYGGGLLLWSHHHDVSGIGRHLAATGRLALSVYILQSLIAALLFYGNGLGFFGQFNALQLLLCAGLTILLLLWLCPCWERHLGAGPLERLWRRIAYP
ncbi:MAG: DUF418 domain-containing protein [Natronospirillum sp.]|uniref:DUF418 domain-containing protein n=1 Tax=Natronospirillum sp. TaxID=2812955 RepID=UPI0025CC9A43|nr:DUF418 domain-containing protein [Natronospirillum sp.]MCH8550644.1 DUF418 domain-containing protein [Natronospirillum sp.]